MALTSSGLAFTPGPAARSPTDAGRRGGQDPQIAGVDPETRAQVD